MKHLHRLAVYAVVLLLSTAMNIGASTAGRLAFGSTETAATVGKSAKKTKKSPQQQQEPTPTVLAVQAGPDCSITRDAVTGVYTLCAEVGDGRVFFSSDQKSGFYHCEFDVGCECSENVATVVKSDKKTANNPQQQHDPSPSTPAV